jgi:hypothetical protein
LRLYINAYFLFISEAHLEDKYVVSMTFDDQKGFGLGVNIVDILTGAVSRGQEPTTNRHPLASSAFDVGLGKNCGSDPKQFSLAQSMTNERLNKESLSKQMDALVDGRQQIVVG